MWFLCVFFSECLRESVCYFCCQIWVGAFFHQIAGGWTGEEMGVECLRVLAGNDVERSNDSVKSMEELFKTYVVSNLHQDNLHL